MKLKLIALLSLFSLNLQAQESVPTEKSLLWEITGNGLEKPSYLYGTMHVSAKIAFRLDDVFFDALNGADMVALETDPSTWLEHYSADGYYSNYFSPWGYRQSGFYKHSFKAENPKKEKVGGLMSFDNNLLNGILYRSSSQMQDFQEDTYLDMFIYQAGKKQSKPIIALEDLDESQMLVDIAAENSRKDKADVWLQKLMVDENFYTIMQEAYRTRDISLLDSLDRGLHTAHYMEYMLYKRNRNMVEVMDSIMHQGSVFSAIGAAHLPGEEGVIKMLRDLGYTVVAFTSERSEVAENQQKRLEELFIEQNYTPQTVDDEYFTINLPDKLYNLGSSDNVTNYISTDLTNGAFVTITRISTKQLIKQENKIDLDVIRDLLFENIPGDIEVQRDIVNGPWKGIEVKNKLKNGDYQHYQMFVTPMEVIIFKLSGKKSFAKQYGDTLFASLKFKNITPNKMVTLKSYFNDFAFEIPENYSFVNLQKAGDREMEAYNAPTDDYYFMKRVQLNDQNLFEVDTFELKQIQKRFYEDLKAYGDVEYGEFGTLRYSRTLRSHALLDSTSDQKLHLMSLKQGMNFYLLGIKTNNAETAKKYFDSFTLSPVTYQGDYTALVDTFVHFSTVSFLEMSKKWNTNLERFADEDEKKKPYEDFYKSNRYVTENGDQIYVRMFRYHDYEMFYNADSIWNYYERNNEDDLIISYKDRGIEHGNPYHVMILSDTACSKAVKIKTVIKHGVKYRLEATIDTAQANNKFIDEFFANFKPADTLIGRDIFEDKTDEFFASLRANDSIVLDAYGSLIFTKEDIDSLKAFVDHFDFPDDKKFLKEKFIYRIGSFWEEDETVIPYLIDLYNKSYENSEIQTDILRFFAGQRTEKATEQMMELLSNDIPLSAYSSGINYIFYPYTDTLELANELFPDLMDYQSIDEYREPIFNLLTLLRSEGIMKAKGVKKYRNQILNDARIELKRQLAKSNKTSRNNYYNSYSSTNRYSTKDHSRELSELEQYIVLLFPFRKEKNMKVFFERLMSLDNHQVITTYISLLAKSNSDVDQELIYEYAKDINKRFNLYEALANVNRLDLFPEEFKTQQLLLESFVYRNSEFKVEKDTIAFLDQKQFEFEGKSYTTYFFKTSLKTGWNKDEWYIKAYTIANFEENKEKDALQIKNTNGIKTYPVFMESRKLLETVELEKQLQKLIEAFELKDHPRATSELDEDSRYYGGYL